MPTFEIIYTEDEQRDMHPLGDTAGVSEGMKVAMLSSKIKDLRDELAAKDDRIRSLEDELDDEPDECDPDGGPCTCAEIREALDRRGIVLSQPQQNRLVNYRGH